MNAPRHARTSAEQEARRRARAALPLIFKPSNLPIAEHKEALLEAIADQQVLVVAGDTGSGKSTQLPQYCLSLGRGLDGMIAHTQPRRLAARALATRIAEETGQPLGKSVGYKVRFADQVSPETRLALMTDGLLLAELNSDPLLKRYDTIIVDEAHERSLNVDLLLGVLKRLLPKRPDLKVIITSATLDVERIARFFDGAPIFKVGGRLYPIEVRYRAGDDAEDPDLPQAVLAAFQEIATEPSEIGNGDVLVFLPGEREIRDVGEWLERELKGVEVLPLYSRLAWDAQSKIFQKGKAQRIVLATNVAETSITVPGIRAVIDSGLARISRYNLRNRLQRLPIEPISQASAEQRKGRCGRIAAGLCIRLYSEESFELRAPFTEPEILRTNLAALLLRLAADGLGNAEEFPFIDAPDSRALNDGYRLLQELEALNEERRITRTGRAMARLPLDPRLARALLESQRYQAESEVLAIVSALSVPDVRISQPGRDRPQREPSEDEAPLEDPRSEFLALVKLWRAYRQARSGTRRELKDWCKQRRFSLLRLSEWEDVHNQVAERARELGILGRAFSASYNGLHRALLAGFCSLIGVRSEEGSYLGPRGVHFHLAPGAALSRRKPRWVMAANIVETSRVLARCVAQIEPKWVETAAHHLLKREYLAPDWDEERGQVSARERIGFLGLILSANRVVNYGPIAPEASKRIFAREALVYQRLQSRPQWLLKNDAVLDAARRLEERLRTRDLVVGAESLVEFYDERLPRQVSSAATLEHFSRHLDAAALERLALTPAEVLTRTPDEAALEQFPEQAKLASLKVPIQYRFAPGESLDGAMLSVPLLGLPTLTRAELQAAIPGYAAPRIEALLRSLPKEARRILIPLPDTARAFLEATGGRADEPALKAWLRESRGMSEALIKFDHTSVPAHLNPQIRVIEQGQEVARGEDLKTLRRHCAVIARRELARLARSLYPLTWRRFESEQLPAEVSVATEMGGQTLYPTLKSRDGSVQVELEWSAAEANRSYLAGAVRLARLMLSGHMKDLAKTVTAKPQFVLAASAYFSSEDLVDVILELAVREACFEEAPIPKERAAFEAAVERGKARIYPKVDQVMQQLSGWLAEASAVRQALDDPRLKSMKSDTDETREHLKHLFHPARLKAASPDWLRQLSRYFKAELRRWQRNQARGSESPAIAQAISQSTDRLAALSREVQAEMRELDELAEFAFWVEEYRVSLYAQELKTLAPISAARLEQRAAEIEVWLNR